MPNLRSDATCSGSSDARTVSRAVARSAAVVGGILSLLLAPLFPMTVVVPLSAFVALPAIATVIGLLASVAGLRRVVAIDPALAFGGP